VEALLLLLPSGPSSPGNGHGADNAGFHTTATRTVAVCMCVAVGMGFGTTGCCFSKKAEEVDLLADEAALEEDIVSLQAAVVHYASRTN